MNNLLAGAPGGASEITNPVLGNLNETNSAGAMSFWQKFIPGIITLGFVAGILIFFFNLITGAIQWISSGGDKQSLESARSKITNAVVGLIILFATFAILNLVEHFFGINILTLDINSIIIK